VSLALPGVRAATTGRGRSTPRLLTTLGLVAVLLTAVLGVLLGSAAAGVRSDVDVLGDAAAPQVTVTTDLSFALSDLDAQATNVLLVGTGENLGDDGPAALQRYQQRATQADADLAKAAAGAAGDDTAQQLIKSTLDGLGQYQSLMGQAFLVSKQGSDPAGHPSAATVALYRQATDLMSKNLAGVRQLTQHEQDLFSDTYAGARSGAFTALAWVLVVGVLLTAALVTAQVVLRIRQRRRLNPALALGTVAAVVFTVVGASVFGGVAGHLADAKTQAFDPIVALSQARAISVDANADESRFLVDPQRTQQYQDAFAQKSQSLMGFPGVGAADYDGAVDKAVLGYLGDWSDITFTGLYGGVLRAPIPAADRPAVLHLLFAYQNYESDDRALKLLAAQGSLFTTIQFDIGADAFDSDWAFTQYDTALTTLTGADQRAFDAGIAAARDDLAGWNLLLPALAVVLLLGLTAVGLYPRLAEYRR
jgi:hypothetical protein